MSNKQEDHYDYCALECALDDNSGPDAGKTFVKKEHSLWLDMFCPELTCLEKDGTNLV